MPANDRGIGSEGLEQGGPSLGNDYTRPTGTGTSTGARDAIIIPHGGQGEERKDDTLNMDNESSRNLSGELTDYDTDLEEDTDDDDDEIMEDDVLQGPDPEEGDDEEDDDENDII